MKKIGYYSYYPNPWIGMARKMWEHHHHIFRIINSDIEDLEIHPMIRPKNKSKIRKLESGDTSVLVDGFQNIKFVFHEEFDNYTDYDALFLEPGRVFMMDEVFAHPDMVSINKHRSNIIHKIITCMNKGLPILWYDGDADLMTTYESGNFAKQLFDDLHMNNYPNCTVIGPYEDCKNKIKNFIFVPYNIDFNTLPGEFELLDASNRNILSTYFGSNYHRNSFIPHFNEVSKYGTMRIFGSSWNGNKMPNVELNKAIWLSEGEFKQYYDESLIGLYGDNDLTNDYKHYTLRICEYLKSGIYIVPDNKDYIVEKFPSDNLFISDFYYPHNSVIEDMLNILRNNYIEMVLYQRSKLAPAFDSYNYCDIYAKALGVICY